jgi:hypothetical protein
MATIPIKCIFTIFLLAVCCCHCQTDSISSSWAKSKISPEALSSVEYGNFLIEIYEHVNNHKATTTANEKKYFYSPIALLDHKSATSTYSRLAKQQEIRFRVVMWNDKVQNEVLKHLNKITGQEIQSDKVRILPLEKVILTSKRPTFFITDVANQTGKHQLRLRHFRSNSHTSFAEICGEKRSFLDGQ